MNFTRSPTTRNINFKRSSTTGNINFTRSPTTASMWKNEIKSFKEENYVSRSTKLSKNGKENILKAKDLYKKTSDERILRKNLENQNDKILDSKKLKNQIFQKPPETKKEKISTTKTINNKLLRKQGGRVKLLNINRNEFRASSKDEKIRRFKKRSFDLSTKEPTFIAEKFMKRTNLNDNLKLKSRYPQSAFKNLSAHIKMMRLMEGMMKKLKALEETNNFMKTMDSNFLQSYERSRSLLNRKGKLRATKYSRLASNSKTSPAHSQTDSDKCITNFFYTKKTHNFMDRPKSSPGKNFGENKTKFNCKSLWKTTSNDIITAEPKTNNFEKERSKTPIKASWDVIYDKIA